MTAGGELDLRPITTADVGGVGAFLRAQLNGRLSAATWAAAIVPPWAGEAPNHGFLIAADRQIVGVQIAIYSERVIMGRLERICNIAAGCTAADYRIHEGRLLRSVLAQPGFTFTDLSPSGASLSGDQPGRFSEIDTRSVLLPNLPKLGRRSVEVTGDPRELAEALTGDDLRLYADHDRCLAARQLLIRSGTEQCHVIYRCDRRKGVATIASILYASAPELLRRALPELRSYLLGHDRAMATTAEIRLIGWPDGAIELPPARRVFWSTRLRADQLDYLYSELTCVP